MDCGGCGKPVQTDWSMCPFCSNKLPNHQNQISLQDNVIMGDFVVNDVDKISAMIKNTSTCNNCSSVGAIIVACSNCKLPVWCKICESDMPHHLVTKRQCESCYKMLGIQKQFHNLKSKFERCVFEIKHKIISVEGSHSGFSYIESFDKKLSSLKIELEELRLREEKYDKIVKTQLYDELNDKYLDYKAEYLSLAYDIEVGDFPRQIIFTSVCFFIFLSSLMYLALVDLEILSIFFLPINFLIAFSIFSFITGCLGFLFYPLLAKRKLKLLEEKKEEAWDDYCKFAKDYTALTDDQKDEYLNKHDLLFEAENKIRFMQEICNFVRSSNNISIHLEPDKRVFCTRCYMQFDAVIKQWDWPYQTIQTLIAHEKKAHSKHHEGDGDDNDNNLLDDADDEDHDIYAMMDDFFDVNYDDDLIEEEEYKYVMQNFLEEHFIPIPSNFVQENFEDLTIYNKSHFIKRQKIIDEINNETIEISNILTHMNSLGEHSFFEVEKILETMNNEFLKITSKINQLNNQ